MMSSTLRAKRAAAAVDATRALGDASLIRRLAEFVGPGRADLEVALRETEAPQVTPLVFAVAVAPLRLVSKSWARTLSPSAIHGRAVAPARRLAAQVELPKGLAAYIAEHSDNGTYDHLSSGLSWHYLLRDSCSDCEHYWDDDILFETAAVLAWEPRPAPEELFARAKAALEFHCAATRWAGRPVRHPPPLFAGDPLLPELRRRFADALVQREWVVDVDTVTIGAEGSDRLVQFARELLPPGAIVDERPRVPNTKVPSPFAPSRVVSAMGLFAPETVLKNALRVVPLAFSAQCLLKEEDYADDQSPDLDERESIAFPGGFALTAAGELPASAYRGFGGGPVGAAVALEGAAAKEQEAIDALEVEEWDDEGVRTASIAALAASRAAYTAMAATLRRSSQTPALYALCSMRALVAARRAEPLEASGVALLCRAQLPREIFRTISSLIGDAAGVAADPNLVKMTRMRGAGWRGAVARDDDLVVMTGMDLFFDRVARTTTHPLEEAEDEDVSGGNESIVPRVVLTFRPTEDSWQQNHRRDLLVSGWLHGFEVFHGHEYGGRWPRKKETVLSRFRSKYHASAMPRQIPGGRVYTGRY